MISPLFSKTMSTQKKALRQTLKLGNCQLNLGYYHPQLEKSFRIFESLSDERSKLISVGEYEKNQYLYQFPDQEWNVYAEYKCLLILASDAMMKEDQFIFHSVALLINEEVWLLSGPSGIGKSTQYRNLKELYKGCIEIISGDNPVLSFEEESITVYPSPWNGKEDWGSLKTGKLAGIVLLEQAKENKITLITPKEAVLPVYKEINTYAKSEEQIRLLSRLEERLLNAVPIYRFENIGNTESSKLLYEQLLNRKGRQ